MLFTEIESRDEHSLAIRGTYYLFRFQKRDGLILSFKKDPPESLPWNQSIPSLFNIGSKHLSVHRIQQAEEIIRTVIGELSGYKKLESLSDLGIFGMPGVLLSYKSNTTFSVQNWNSQLMFWPFSRMFTIQFSKIGYLQIANIVLSKIGFYNFYVKSMVWPKESQI